MPDSSVEILYFGFHYKETQECFKTFHARTECSDFYLKIEAISDRAFSESGETRCKHLQLPFRQI